MVRFLVLYPQPTDVEAFERHYFEVHLPLVKKLSGPRSYAVSRNASPVRGPEPSYLSPSSTGTTWPPCGKTSHPRRANRRAGMWTA